MASPSFILLAKSVSLDKETNELSVFHIIEKMQVSFMPAEQPGARTIVLWSPLKLVAEWVIDNDDKIEDEFEFEFIANLPGKSEPIQLPAKGKFNFLPNTLRHRIIVTFQLPFPLEKATGILRFEGRVKKTTSSTWSSQAYSVFIEQAETTNNIFSIPSPPL